MPRDLPAILALVAIYLAKSIYELVRDRQRSTSSDLTRADAERMIASVLATMSADHVRHEEICRMHCATVTEIARQIHHQGEAFTALGQDIRELVVRMTIADNRTHKP